MKRNVSFLVFWGIFVGCSVVGEKNPLFEGTSLIITASPKGTVSVPLTFTWSSPERIYYQVVAVFTNTIRVEGKKIVNTNDCIAMWTSGMPGQAGNVSYSDFKAYPSFSSPPPSLSSGTYYWAVWAYNDRMEVTHSSAQISFTLP
ncbi:hypothetical protein [Thermospira aquatica]|uniref:Lipoprotein n=1 Tax=Thermospira aquatica TaxID=2828656 RepID=A0AAX3BC90_9SPIR|nr:hypothetical protein [Thermospira aquatica]URA09848.1 hypothetical protein KDW03_10240 [Thermospira aquatica]